VPPEQKGKKHGKRIVNQGDGFASVAYDGGRKQLVPGFTNRKDRRHAPRVGEQQRSLG
jgi:hypothetical protein